MLEIPQAPKVSDFCSRYFRFCELFFAGQTYAQHAPPNTPRELETWEDYSRLARDILDPLRDRFGPLEITYGFASRDLLKLIPKNISPSRDQHAGSELSREKRFICERRGAAVDFFIPDLSSLEVAAWIVQNLNFDRMYFYGKERPIHISFSRSPMNVIFSMERSKVTGLRVPRKINHEAFVNSSK